MNDVLVDELCVYDYCRLYPLTFLIRRHTGTEDLVIGSNKRWYGVEGIGLSILNTGLSATQEARCWYYYYNNEKEIKI